MWIEAAYFLTGMVIGLCLGLEGSIELWLKNLNWRNWHRPTRENITIVMIAVACIFMVSIGITCLQLIQDLRNQSRLGRLSDEFSLQVSEATVKKEKCQNQLSEDVLNLPAFDPRRVAIFRACQVEYFNTVGPLNKKRAQVVRERNDSPK